LDRKTKGRLAEIAVLKELIAKGYEPYLPFCDNSKYDMLAIKEKKLIKISIKYTATRGKTKTKETWSVSLKQVSRRANNAVAVTLFNPEDWDMLAVYIGPEDRVVLIPIDETFNATTGIYLPARLTR